jgi:hypothetical protein
LPHAASRGAVCTRLGADPGHTLAGYDMGEKCSTAVRSRSDARLTLRCRCRVEVLRTQHGEAVQNAASEASTDAPDPRSPQEDAPADPCDAGRTRASSETSKPCPSPRTSGAARCVASSSRASAHAIDHAEVLLRVRDELPVGGMIRRLDADDSGFEQMIVLAQIPEQL